MGQSGTRENSQCIVDAGPSSLQLSGTNVTITMAVTFKTGYIGSKAVWEQAEDNEGLTSSAGYYQVGSYLVTPPPLITGLSPSSGSAAEGTGPHCCRQRERSRGKVGANAGGARRLRHASELAVSAERGQFQHRQSRGTT